MDYRDAWTALLTLAADYAPKPMPWTDPAAEDSVKDTLAKRWIALFVSYPDDIVETAIAEFQRNSPGWPPTYTEMMTALSMVKHRVTSSARRLNVPQENVVDLPTGLRIALDAYKRDGGKGAFGHFAEDALNEYDRTGDDHKMLRYTDWLKR